MKRPIFVAALLSLLSISTSALQATQRQGETPSVFARVGLPDWSASLASEPGSRLPQLVRFSAVWPFPFAKGDGSKAARPSRCPAVIFASLHTRLVIKAPAANRATATWHPKPMPAADGGFFIGALY